MNRPALLAGALSAPLLPATEMLRNTVLRNRSSPDEEVAE
ncbi:hypothetical protein EYZ11_002756 [Aspergillus tanneri]|uniref:Uncharacterized protein n=1 Tax=Aspergillus tanneri TaxID=1220188 RepID=A0A4V3UQ59_9EURO|nr:hypothetical protein EYZ11_002756 [Aspergillus tanneri]